MNKENEIAPIKRHCRPDFNQNILVDFVVNCSSLVEQFIFACDMDYACKT